MHAKPTTFTALFLAAFLLVPVLPVLPGDALAGEMLVAQAPPPGQWPPPPDQDLPPGQQRQPGQRRPPGNQPPPQGQYQPPPPPGYQPPPPGYRPPPPPPGYRPPPPPPGYRPPPPPPGYRPPPPGYRPGPWGPGGGWRAQALAQCAQEQAYCAQMCNASYYGGYRDQCNVNCNAVYVACVNRANTMP